MITKQQISRDNQFLMPAKNWILAIALLMFSANQISAQDRVISGVVNSLQDNEPLSGAYITIKGTEKVAVTGFDGYYSIKVSPNDVLVYSFIGYKDKEELMSAQSKGDVTLDQDTEQLKKVTVIGFGKKKSAASTTSVVSIESAKKG